MPLDNPQKIAHLQAAIARTYQGRQQTMVFVYQSGSSYTYTAVSVVFRKQEIIDPEVPNVGGTSSVYPTDTYIVAPLGTNFTGVVYVADTATATAGAVAAAPKYEVIEAVLVGILPGGTHIRALLRRLR